MSLGVEMSSVETGRQAMLSYLAPFDLDERVLNRVEVVLEEMVSNVVRHSRDADQLTIGAKCCNRAVHIVLEDNGAAFNPLEQPEPARFASLEEASVGGQGIPLIRRLSKSVTYDRVTALNRICVEIAAL